MKSILKALDAMLPSFVPLDAETVPLEDAHRRHLAADVTGRFDSPPFDNSAMDGYAVRAEDVARASKDKPVRLPIKGESRAGGPLPESLTPGTACRIFTGAPMPRGADAVVIQEDTERDVEDVVILEASDVGKHVRPQGSDLRTGTAILRAGTRLLAGELGLLTSQNITSIDVYRKPRVAILSTGDELRPLGAALEPGTIVNSNAYALAAQIEDVGAEPVPLPIVPDELDLLIDALRTALQYDVVLCSGGASVGEYDLVQQAFTALGIETAFWKVRIKPGKPISFATHRGIPIVGLPGNPISAMVTFEILVAPGLRKMLGDPAPHPQPIRAKLATPYRRRPGRVEIARGQLTIENGEARVALLARQGSGSLTSFVDVNALVVFPAETGEWAVGDEVEAFVWGSGPRGDTSVFRRY